MSNPTLKSGYVIAAYIIVSVGALAVLGRVGFLLNNEYEATIAYFQGAIERSQASVTQHSLILDEAKKRLDELRSEKDNLFATMRGLQGVTFSAGAKNVTLVTFSIVNNAQEQKYVKRLAIDYRLLDIDGSILEQSSGTYQRITNDLTNYRLLLSDGSEIASAPVSDYYVYFPFPVAKSMSSGQVLQGTIKADIVIGVSGASYLYQIAAVAPQVGVGSNDPAVRAENVYAPQVLIGNSEHTAVTIQDVENWQGGWEIGSEKQVTFSSINAPPEAKVALLMGRVKSLEEFIVADGIPVFSRKAVVRVPEEDCSSKGCVASSGNTYWIRAVLYEGDSYCTSGCPNRYTILASDKFVHPVELFANTGGGIDLEALSIKTDVVDAGRVGSEGVLFSYNYINNGPQVFGAGNLALLLYNKTRGVSLAGGASVPHAPMAVGVPESYVIRALSSHFECSPEGVENIIEFVVDSDGAVAESNETNNTVTTTVLCTR